jgi:hypothetical protein
MKIQCCLITAKVPDCVTKEFSLIDGQLQKKTTASISEGQMQVIGFDTPQQFIDLLLQLRTDQCLTYGVPPRDADLITEKEWNLLGKPEDPLPRSKAVFSWPVGAAVMMLDYDAPKDSTKPMSKKELVHTLLSVCPKLKSSGLIWWPSTSSHIYAGDNKVAGLKGQRIYLLVKHGTDIERAGKVLNERLWSNGFGRYEVGQDGKLLNRSVFDVAVWQTNRIDFAAGAKCGTGLEQRRGQPVLLGGHDFELLDSLDAIPDLTADEIQRSEIYQSQWKSKLESQAKTKKMEWIKAKVDEIKVANPKLDSQQIDLLVHRALERNDLSGDWLITVKDENGLAKQITVLEALDFPDKYDSAITLDPIEPEYDGGRWVGKLYIKGARPNLYSFAHGGKVYLLHRQPAKIELTAGKSTEATDKLLEVMRSANDIFDFGMEIVRVGYAGTMHTLNENSLRYVVGGLVQFWTKKKLASNELVEVLRDPPTAICSSVISLGSQRRLKPLMGVITAPTLRADGSLLNTSGYDLKTELIFEPVGDISDIPLYPSRAQALQAIKDLWMPFENFPFCGPVDKAVHLAALLTASVRSSMTVAPGFAYDAPSQGSGKTLLARCVGVLLSGTEPSVWAHTAGRDDEEIRKRIFTVLRSGARVLIWDNVVGTFDSPSMASCMTSPMLTDRILGQSSSSTVPNRMMLILTGNNLTLQGEMPRRVLVCRIDPAVERPFSRHFELEPFGYCRANRQKMIASALTLIRAYMTHGISASLNGRLASFEAWDECVRHTVSFANELLPDMFGDVMDSIVANQSADPELETLTIFLKAWFDAYSTRPISTSDLITSVSGNLVDPRLIELKKAIEDLPLSNNQQLNSKSIGRYLGYRKGRVAGGLVLEQGLKVKERQTWRVKRVGSI